MDNAQCLYLIVILLSKSSNASVVSLASSTENPFEISASSPGINVLTNPAARMSKYLRASAWLARGDTNPLRSLLESSVLTNGGRVPFPTQRIFSLKAPSCHDETNGANSFLLRFISLIVYSGKRGCKPFEIFIRNITVADTFQQFL